MNQTELDEYFGSIPKNVKLHHSKTFIDYDDIDLPFKSVYLGL